MRLQGHRLSRKAQTLLAKGRRLTDRDLMLAAAMNYPTLSVHRRPKVAVLGTGDELVAPGSTPEPGEIVYSNGFALLALARSEGAEAIDLGIARDTARGHRCGACARARDAAPMFWSPPAAPPSASMIWCSGRSPPKGSTCRSGGWRCGRAGR